MHLFKMVAEPGDGLRPVAQWEEGVAARKEGEADGGTPQGGPEVQVEELDSSDVPRNTLTERQRVEVAAANEPKYSNDMEKKVAEAARADEGKDCVIF